MRKFINKKLIGIVSAAGIILVTGVIVLLFLPITHDTVKLWKGRYSEIRVMALNSDTVSTAGQTGNLCFKVRIDPAQGMKDSLYFHNSDIIYGFGRTWEEASDINNKFTFGLYSSIWLNLQGERIQPTLCHMEKNFAMDNGRDIWVSFKLGAAHCQQFAEHKKIQLYVSGIFQKEKMAIFDWQIGNFL